MFLRKARPEFKRVFLFSFFLHVLVFVIIASWSHSPHQRGVGRVPLKRLSVNGVVSQKRLMEHIQPKSIQTELHSAPKPTISTVQKTLQPSRQVTLGQKTGLKPVLPPVKNPQNARALATKTASQNALSQAKKIVSTRERSAEVNKKPMPRVETQHNLALDSSTQVKEQGSSRSEKSTNAQRLAVNDVSGQQKNLPKSQPVSPQIVTAEKLEKQRLEREQEQLRKQKEAQALALKKQQEDARKKEEALKAKRALEAKKKEEERLKKLEADRIEKARLEAERLKKLEAERLEKARLEAIRLQAIDRAEDRRLIAQFSQEIVEKLRPHYHLPPGLEGHITTVLEVSLNSTGDVQQVQLKKSSGNDTHDRAAIAAIMKASPLPIPGKKSARDKFLVFDLTVSPKSMLQTDP